MDWGYYAYNFFGYNPKLLKRFNYSVVGFIVYKCWKMKYFKKVLKIYYASLFGNCRNYVISYVYKECHSDMLFILYKKSFKKFNTIYIYVKFDHWFYNYFIYFKYYLLNTPSVTILLSF